MMWLFLIASFVLYNCADGSPYGHEDDSLNLFPNSGFELQNKNHWNEPAGSRIVTSINSCHEGRKCAFISGPRPNNKATIRRTIVASKEPRLKSGTDYYISAFVRLTNKGQSQGAKFRLFYEIFYTNGTISKTNVGIMPFQQVNKRWRQIGGDMATRSMPIKKIDIWVQLEPKSAEFYLDSMAFTEIPSIENNWNAVLDAEIIKHRTCTLKVKTSTSRRKRYNKLTVEVKQLSLGMKFGTAVQASLINGNDNINVHYRKFLKERAKVVVFENEQKWTSMQNSEYGTIRDFGVPAAINWTKSNEIGVHGHAILWEPISRNPIFLGAYRKDEFRDRLKKRIKYMLDKYNTEYPVETWDLLNEPLQSNYYSVYTEDNQIYSKLYKYARQIYPQGTYCVSDFLIARKGWFASAIKEFALDLESEGGKSDCIGIQSHIRIPPINAGRLAKRILIASQAGVPLIITEMTVHSFDLDVRAENTIKALKVYYANPNVIKINTWGFSDVPGIQFTGDTGFTTGKQFKLNKVGDMIYDLFDDKWNSTATYTAPKNKWRGYTKTLPEFHHGTYKITLKLNDVVKDSKIVTLDNSQNVFEFSLRGR